MCRGAKRLTATPRADAAAWFPSNPALEGLSSSARVLWRGICERGLAVGSAVAAVALSGFVYLLRQTQQQSREVYRKVRLSPLCATGLAPYEAEASNLELGTSKTVIPTHALLLLQVFLSHLSLYLDLRTGGRSPRGAFFSTGVSLSPLVECLASTCGWRTPLESREPFARTFRPKFALKTFLVETFVPHSARSVWKAATVAATEASSRSAAVEGGALPKAAVSLEALNRAARSVKGEDRVEGLIEVYRHFIDGEFVALPAPLQLLRSFWRELGVEPLEFGQSSDSESKWFIPRSWSKRRSSASSVFASILSLLVSSKGLHQWSAGVFAEVKMLVEFGLCLSPRQVRRRLRWQPRGRKGKTFFRSLSLFAARRFLPS